MFTKELSLRRFLSFRVWLFGLLIASVAMYCFWVTRTFGYTMDDSYITYRFASNLISGAGFRFNFADGEPVEGFTSLVWLLVSALLQFFGAEVVVASKVVSILAALLAGTLIYLTIKRFAAGAFASLAAIAVAASYFSFWPVFVASVSGMETALCTFVSALVAYNYARFLRCPSQRDAILFSLLNFVGGLLRPDFFLISSVLFCSLLLFFWIESERRVIAAIAVGCYVLLGAIYFCWRWSYFKVLLPLPFYIKVGGQSFAGVPDVLSFFSEPAIWLALALSLFSRGVGRAFLLAVSVFSAAYSVPLHLMGVGHRFLMPVLPFLLVSSGFGMVSLAQSFPQKKIAQILVVVFVVLQVFIGAVAGSAHSEELNYYAKALNQSYRMLGLQLAKRGTKGVLAISSVGVVSWASSWTVVDMFGLCNRSIALHPESRIATVFSYRPDVIALVSSSKTEYSPYISEHRSDFNAEIYDHAVRDGYRVSQIIEFWSGFYLFVLEKNVSASALGV